MDDPWGSPWTTTDADTPSKRAPSPAKSDLEPPPRAFLSAISSPRLPASPAAQSPWADDDDGFGDWAAGSTAAETTQSNSVWGGWGGSDINSSRERLSPRSRDNSFTLTSPIKLPGNIAHSPGLRPHSNSILRQLSPDPWASDFRAEESHRDLNLQPTPRLIVDEPVLSPIHTPKAVPPSEFGTADSLWGAFSGESTAEERGDPSPKPTDERASSPNLAARDHSTTEQPLADGAPRASKDAAQSIRSRSSTVSGDQRNHGANRQDSLPTSIGGDIKTHPQPAPRKGSGKVQELVYKFDGLANPAVEDPIPAARDRGPTTTVINGHGLNTTDDDSDYNADFGDFEDADSATPVPPTEASSPLKSPPIPATPKAPRPRAPDFTIDLSLVNTLFQDDDPDHDEPTISTADVPVSDRIIRDSFGEISERKTWYRISRQGSSRKHDAGDDDGYCRVIWGPSTVHKETLGIVRRWMEEDSITGRTDLRGGFGRSNMFGWDSDADPVALDKVFGKRKKEKLKPLSRVPSLQQPTSSPLTPSTAVPPYHSARHPNGETAPPFAPRAASFGWSTASPPPLKPPPATPDQPVFPSIPSLKPEQTPPRPPQRQPSQGPTKSVLPPLNTATPPSALADNDGDDDDDDEWGEMMSSPEVERGSIPTHELGSLDAVFSKSPPPPVPAQAPQPKASPLVASLISTSGNTQRTQPRFPSPVQHAASMQKNPSISSNSKSISDLSLLESSGEPALTADSGIPTAPSGKSSTPVTTKSVPFSPVVSIKARSTAPSTTTHSHSHSHSHSHTSKQESQKIQDDLVRKIIADLPDLSYMLR